MQVKKNSKKIKEENLNKIKHNNIQGITLIALVVTIIILIILAGVSINLVLGDNGIITKAKYAKEQQEMAQIKEKLEPKYKLDKKQIIIKNPISSLGFHEVEIHLYKDIIAKIKIEVKK